MLLRVQRERGGGQRDRDRGTERQTDRLRDRDRDRQRQRCNVPTVKQEGQIDRRKGADTVSI